MRLFRLILAFIPIFALSGQEEEISLYMPAPVSGADMALETRGRLYEKLNRFFDWVMSFQDLSYFTLSEGATYLNPPVELSDFFKQHGFFSTLHPLVGQLTPAKEDIQIVESLLLTVGEKIQDPFQRSLYISEILAKILAYRTLEKGMKIQIPSFNPQEAVETFEVVKVFDLGLKMPAYGLVSQHRSFLLYRGTHLDLTDKAGLASIIADLDLYGPGYTAFFHAKDQIEAFLIQQNLNQKKTVVTGYSLGGSLTFYTQIFLSSYIDQNLSTAFNPPGVQKKMLKVCAVNPSLNGLKVYVSDYDPISKWGFLIGNVQVLKAKEKMGPLAAHTALMGGQEELAIYPCDLEAENDRHHYFFLPEK